MSCTARLCRGWLCTTLVLPVAFWLAACQSPTDTPRNVVLIVIDTVRADHLSVYGYHRPTSPSLQQLASRGALFSRAHATASYTRASTASILTGQYPVVHGAITHSDSMSPQIPTLAEVFKSAGFSTVGIYRNGNVAGTFGFDRGFDSYEVPDKDFLRRAKGDPEIGDVVYVSQTDDSLLTSSAVPFLEGQATGARPFFLYLHLGGAHDPYSPPPTAPTFFEGELTDTARLFYTQPLKPLRDGPTALRQILRGTAEVDDRTREQIVALYDGEIAFADAQVGAILEALEKAGKADETLVIVTADHGEEFWDHGSLGHGESHFQEQLHVPLIVAGPGVRPGTIEEPVSLIDLFPTILDLLRIGGTQEHMPGRSLRSALARPEREFDPRSVYAEGLLRDGGHGEPIFYRSLQLGDLKLILDFERKRKRLFDLAADPGERQDLVDSRSTETRRLQDRLLGIHGENLRSPFLTAVTPVDIPEDLAADLQALGYLGSPDDTAYTTTLFRRPLRRFDADGYGLVGHEAEIPSYSGSLDLGGSDFPQEQLLFGWRPAGAEGRHVMANEAAVRLARGSGQGEWRLHGKAVSSPDGEVIVLEARIDGGESRSFRLPSGQEFLVRGDLPSSEEDTARLDFRCRREPASADGIQRRAGCALVTQVEMLPASGVRNPALPSN